MLLKRLLDSLRRPTQGAKPQVEHLGGVNWLVRGRHGVYIANENDICIGRALIRYGEYSELEWQLLERYVRRDDVVVEVGANIGAHTVSLGKAVGAHGGVVAIEPQPAIFQILCANAALNVLNHVRALNCGCAASAGVMHVPILNYDAEGNFGGIALQATGGTSASAVAVQRLDDLLAGAPRIDLMKIDVEGMECEVLAGARDVIERFHPVLYLENDRAGSSRELIESIAAFGYRLWWHVPRLYNAENYFGTTENLYPRIASFNMLCLHPSSARETPRDLEEVTDPDWHPHPSIRNTAKPAAV